jgi:hypothetical protein
VNRLWTDTEDEFVRQNADFLKDREIAAALTRLAGRHVTEAAVRTKRTQLGIKKKPGRGVCQVRRPAPPTD